jgi:uncharacterized protein YndB with AHSA1/START domain
MINANEGIESQIVGIWAPVSGNPADTMEYRADGTVRMAMFGGAYHMEGSYRFIEPDVVELAWGASISPEAGNVVRVVSNRLQENGVEAKLAVVKKSVLQISVTESELKTLHLEKGRIGHFHRV